MQVTLLDVSSQQMYLQGWIIKNIFTILILCSGLLVSEATMSCMFVELTSTEHRPRPKQVNTLF